MGKPKTGRVKANAMAVPQSRDQAAAAIGRMGELQRQRSRIEAEMGDRIAVIRARYEEQAQPLALEIEEIQRAVTAWAEAHREELLPRGTKTVQLPTGEIAWRTTPPRCAVRNPELVVETLERLGLERFVRVKKEPNKEAMLAEPEALRGVSGVAITQREEIVISPYQPELVEP